MKSLQENDSIMHMELASHTVSAAAFIFKKGRLLLIHNPRKGWETPGGIIENGETLIATLKREIQEECGLCVEIQYLSSITSVVNSSKGYNGVKKILPLIIFDFVCECDQEEVILSEEHDDYCWIEIDQAFKLIRKDLLFRLESSLNKKIDFFGCTKEAETEVFEEIRVGE